MWTEEQAESPEYLSWLDAEWAKIVDEAVAFRRQEEQMAAEEVPVPDGDEPPF